jgi:hypothetical protein
LYYNQSSNKYEKRNYLKKNNPQNYLNIKRHIKLAKVYIDRTYNLDKNHWKISMINIVIKFWNDLIYPSAKDVDSCPDGNVMMSPPTSNADSSSSGYTSYVPMPTKIDEPTLPWWLSEWMKNKKKDIWFANLICNIMKDRKSNNANKL